MNIMLIIAHPNVKSFNRAIADTAAEVLKESGHTILFHDLYGEGFEPLLTNEEILKDTFLQPAVARHCAEATSADGFVIVHPNWWGQPPAILKGWIDRVFRPGVAYEFLEGDRGEGIPRGLLKAHAAVVFNTSNTPQEREMNVFGDPLETIWKQCIFGLCGIKNVYRKTFRVIVTSTPEERSEWLQEVKEVINTFFPMLHTLKKQQ